VRQWEWMRVQPRSKKLHVIEEVAGRVRRPMAPAGCCATTRTAPPRECWRRRGHRTSMTTPLARACLQLQVLQSQNTYQSAVNSGGGPQRLRLKTAEERRRAPLMQWGGGGVCVCVCVGGGGSRPSV
jgi:hypothetical protein